MKHEQFIISSQCTGCRACECVCPVYAISMEETVEGFREPQIDWQKCVNCRLCQRICPQENNILMKRSVNQEAYAAQLLNKDVLMTSTSGAFFAALALEVLYDGGVVFGVQMDEQQHATYYMVTSEEQLYQVQSSKYVASDPLDSYCRTRVELEHGKTVLYSGCPCQVAGLRAYLRKLYPNLLTVDIVCHGTPSQKLFDIYRAGMEKKIGHKIEDYRFRDKSRYGWGVYWSYICNEKKKNGGLHDDPYISAFIDGAANRECCYNCHYVEVENRMGDVTLGDYWCVDQIHPDMASKDGVSAVIANTEDGKEWTKRALSHCKWVSSSAEKIAQYNSSLIRSSERPARRNHIYDGIDTKTPRQFVEENLKLSLKGIIKTKLRLLIPYKIRVYMKVISKAHL